ncbi:hypothetical protein GOC75_12265 [Sinorhizobium medicae]|nr:hypothetical protein [Sinorhizobium medicae]
MTVPTYPESERIYISHIEGELMSLGRYVGDFGSAVSLFNFCNQFGLDVTSRWQFVAARDGAMSIYHVAKAIEGIRACFRDCPTYKEAVDHSKLREAAKELHVTFPGYDQLRHAIAHNAELRRNVEHASKNATQGPFEDFGVAIDAGSSVSIGNGLNGNKFFTSIEGVMASYEISYGSLRALSKILDIFENGFIPAGYTPLRMLRQLA